MRWIFNAPLAALNEILGLVFAVAVAATMPAGLANKVNLKVDLLARFMTPRLGLLADVVGGLFLLAFFAVLAWQIDVYSDQLADQGRATVMLGLPEAPFVYGVAGWIAIGCIVQLVVTLNQFRVAVEHPRPGPGTGAVDLVSAPRATSASGIGSGGVGVYLAVAFDNVSAWSQVHVGLEALVYFPFSPFHARSRAVGGLDGALAGVLSARPC